MNRRTVLANLTAALMIAIIVIGQPALGKGEKSQRGYQDKPQRRIELPSEATRTSQLSFILGCPTDKSVTISILSAKNITGHLDYGTSLDQYTNKTDTIYISAGKPTAVVFGNLSANTRYFYRLNYDTLPQSSPTATSAYSFHTQRPTGSTFSFAVQGDSHPERPQQNDPRLYAQTLLNAASENPDFYVAIGDDFNVDTLRTVNLQTVNERYILQRPFLGIVGHSSPIFLVNGNHEQAAACNLDGTPNNVAVWAQNARNLYYPQPAPDRFYSGDTEPVEFVGQLRDYYAWNWGDALFVVIDPYWHSAVPVDNPFGGGHKVRDLWSITLGDTQYEWFKKTLEQSKAKYKFVFSHHVMGTGRGGIEQAELYEWGGKNKNGRWEFDQKRPGWEAPIHQLMAKHGVTVFFQGHDHIFARQELDGVIYQTLPDPANPQYITNNEHAYKSGVTLPGSGYLKATVSPEQVKVDYIRSRLSTDETDQHKNGELGYSYTITR